MRAGKNGRSEALSMMDRVLGLCRDLVEEISDIGAGTGFSLMEQ
jgi:hypothetical protein